MLPWLVNPDKPCCPPLSLSPLYRLHLSAVREGGGIIPSLNFSWLVKEHPQSWSSPLREDGQSEQDRCEGTQMCWSGT